MSPMVSVIIPAFNCARFLSAAVESIGKQGYPDTEILIVDDGSTDGTWETILTLRSSYPGIVPLRNHRRKGPSGARNTGLMAASGIYVAFLDADDLWLPHHLPTAIPFLESNPGADAVFFNFDVVDLDSGTFLFNWFEKRTFQGKLDTAEAGNGFRTVRSGMVDALLDECFIHLQALVLRRRSLAGVLFDEDLIRQEDRDFTLRLALDAGARYAYSHLVTGIYHRHNDSLTHPSPENIVRTTDDHIRLFCSYLERFSFPRRTVRRIRRTVRDRLLSNSYFYRKEGHFSSSAEAVLKSFRWGCSFTQGKELLKTGIEFALGKKRRLQSRG